MKLHLSLIKKLLLFSCLFFFNTDIKAAEENNGLVEVEIPEDVHASYRTRRASRGGSFSVQLENYLPNSYSSFLDGSLYRDNFGSSEVPLLMLEGAYKVNGKLGSISIGISAGQGKVSSNISGQDRSIEITKFGLSSRLTLDAIFEEPYVAPYVGINYWQMGIHETTPSFNDSRTIQGGTNFRVGILVQLDWIDYEQAKKATFGWGLENSFIDLYLTQYSGGSSNDQDPNMSTDSCLGAGLTLEF